MLFSAVVLCLAVAASFSQQPEKPELPATFEAEVGVEYHEEESHGVLFGDGTILSDYTGNMAKEIYNLTDRDESRRTVLNLQRYDMGQVFEINSQDPTDCNHREVTGHLPDFWAFLSTAEFAGQRVFHERDLDCWVQRLSFGVELEVCVDAEEATERNRPILFRRHTPEIEVFFDFRTFNGTTPVSRDFLIPKECEEPPPAQTNFNL